MRNSPLLETAHRALFDAATTRFEPMEAREGQGDDASLAAEVAALGFYPYLFPKEFGGALPHVDVRSICVLRDALAYRNPAADSVFAVQGLGSHPVLLGGNAAQKQALLPLAASGRALFAFALTEKDAGSDVAAIATQATETADAFVLNGAKRFISNAGVATHYTVFARTGPGPRGLSAFVVPHDAPGFSVSKKLELMSAHPIGELEFNSCRIPKSALLGQPGEGMKLALSTLDVFRATVGAAALGMARRALDEAMAYASSRVQFGKPLAELEAVQTLIADSAVDLDAGTLLVLRAAAAKDSGQARVTYEAAVGKLFATEAASRVIDRSLQIHGGNGVVKGAVVERLYRDVRALRIYEGASEVQRLVIARQKLQHGERPGHA